MSLTLGAVLALVALGPGPDGTTATPPPAKDATGSNSAPAKALAPAVIPIEKRPYKIRAWLAVDPRARVDHRGREIMVAGWKVMVSRFVGAPWSLEIAEGDGPLATNELNEVTQEMVIPQAKGYDKAWLFKVEPDAGGGLSISGREFDAATAKIGLLCRRRASVPGDAPRALLQLALDVFAASAEIGDPAGSSQKIRIQGAMLPAANPIGQVAIVGSIFRPTRVFYKPDGGIQLIDVIRKTYLRVESLEAGVATCAINSAIGNPFTNKVRGKFKMVAVGLKPASIPTRLRFLSMKPEQRPLAGYDLVARPAPDGSPRHVGTTDRDGRIVLDPGFSDGLVILRLMAAGIEPLVQFPIMPGEQVEEMTIDGIDTLPTTVTCESELYALQAEIVDLVVTRHRLETRLKSRVASENWDDVKLLLDDFKKLPPRANFETQLTKLDTDLSKQAQANRRQRIRTGTAQSLLKDTKSLIDQYLDDEDFAQYERGLAEHDQAAKTKGPLKALPKAPPISMGLTAKAPGSGPVDLEPPGAGFHVTMPNTPSESVSKTPDGTSEIKSYRVAEPGKGLFIVEHYDYPIALTQADTTRVLDAERDRIAGTLPGSKIVNQKSITLSGQDGKEVQFEVTGAKGVTAGYVSRIVLVNSRIFTTSFGGPKDALASQPATDFLNSFRLTIRGNAKAAAAAPPPSSAPDEAAATTAAPAAKKTQKAPSPASRPKTPGGGTPF
ncbi:MAG: hypothetical protein JWN86_2352 [Planctomycetota bacterium]|nr:hypothetical protein [Planctomycetota bacterium]